MQLEAASSIDSIALLYVAEAGIGFYGLGFTDVPMEAEARPPRGAWPRRPLGYGLEVGMVTDPAAPVVRS
jgi:hypothetical protein